MPEPVNDSVHEESLRKFRVTTLRLSAVATAAVSLIAYAAVDEAAGAGALLGGIAGILGFRLITGRVQRLSTIPPEKLHAVMLAGTYVRLGLYAVFLVAGYLLDREQLHGMFGALAGIFVVRLVPVYAAIIKSRSDRRAAEPEPGAGD